MKINKRAVTIGLIASAILGAGYGFHKQPALASVLGYQSGISNVPTGAIYTAAEQTNTRALPRPPMDMRPPLQPVNRPHVVRAVPASAQPSPAIDGDTDSAGRACTPTLDAALIDGALALLALDAPCDPGARVDIRHGGLAFSGRTDAYGRFSTAVPALTILARFEADIGTTTAEVTLAAPDAPRMRRLAVQWTGTADLDLHALEFGAISGGPGHVWRQAPGNPWAEGGTLMQLGQSDLAVAQVYSFPADLAGRIGVVDMSVQANITTQTCGKTVQATVIQTLPDGIPKISPLTLQMPDCNALGSIRVLKKPAGHMKIASN